MTNPKHTVMTDDAFEIDALDRKDRRISLLTPKRMPPDIMLIATLMGIAATKNFQKKINKSPFLIPFPLCVSDIFRSFRFFLFL
jgi:hypothetical protein